MSTKKNASEKREMEKNAVEYLEQCCLLARSAPYDGPCFIFVGCPLNIGEYRSCVIGVTESVDVCFRDVDDGDSDGVRAGVNTKAQCPACRDFR